MVCDQRHTPSAHACGFRSFVRDLQLAENSGSRHVLKGRGFEPCRKSREINLGFTFLLKNSLLGGEALPALR
jgi:hypothetical protein